MSRSHLTVRDRLFEHTVESMEDYGGANARRVAYLSAEYLPGPHLANNLLNLGITEAAREALRRLGYELDEILAQEEEPGLGNGSATLLDHNRMGLRHDKIFSIFKDSSRGPHNYSRMELMLPSSQSARGWLRLEQGDLAGRRYCFDTSICPSPGAIFSPGTIC